MKRDITVEVEENPESGELWIFCASCESGTSHHVLTQCDYQETINDPHFEHQAWETFQVVQCGGCKRLSFRKTHTDTESEELNEFGQLSLKETEELFPKRLHGRKGLRETYRLPVSVRAIYVETKKAIGNDMNILAGVGIRALVESVCQDVSASGGNLKEKIDDLVLKGVMTSSGSDILHSLRLLGNESVHEIKPQEEDVLDTAFDVVEHLLNTVYIIPEKADSTDLPT